jgi:hypothetical protein
VKGDTLPIKSFKGMHQPMQPPKLVRNDAHSEAQSCKLAKWQPSSFPSLLLMITTCHSSCILRNTGVMISVAHSTSCSRHNREGALNLNGLKSPEQAAPLSSPDPRPRETHHHGPYRHQLPFLGSQIHSSQWLLLRRPPHTSPAPLSRQL